MTFTQNQKPKRTSIALTREEYEVLDKARSHFSETHGINISRSSFVVSLANQYAKQHGL